MKIFTKNAFNINNTSFKHFFAVALVFIVGQMGWGQTATYTVSTTSAVTSGGTAPSGSSATYTQSYATAKQLTSGNSATLTLSGYAGYKITSIVLEMRSNGTAGAGTLSVVAGSTSIASVSPTANFSSSSWYGAYSSTYVDVTKTPTAYTIGASQNVVITIAATTNSLYIQKYTIVYEAAATCTAPTSQATTFTGSATGPATANIGWQRGNGTAGVLVVARSGAAVNTDPTSGTDYTANAAFGSGTQIGTGNYVVYKGTGTSANITGLTAGTAYHFAVYEYNTTSTCYNLTKLTGNVTTSQPPSLAISGSLTENTTLNNGQVNLTLSNDTFADATLLPGNFTLNNAPSGVTISGVTYNTPTTATITLAYNGTDFDTNVTNFNVTVANAELAVSISPLTSSNLTITAVAEALTLGALSSAFGSQCLNMLSSDRTFTVSSSTVLKAGNISLAALNGFTYCETQNGIYNATLSFSHAGGTLSAKTIYVKFLPTAANSYDGNIGVSGAGAPNVNRSVTATGTSGTVTATTVAATSVSATGATSGGNTVSTTCGTITAKGVVWGTAANPTIAVTTKTNEGAGTADYVSAITGLSSNTTYNYRAYATNSNGVTSYGTNLTFTTPCTAVTPSYTNNFSTFPGSCWNANLSEGTPATGPIGTTAMWESDGFLNSGTSGATKVNLYSFNTIGWLRTIGVNLSAGGYRVKFNYGVTAYNATTPAVTTATDDTVKFLISNDGGTTWTVLHSWDSPNSTVSNISNDYSYNLSSYTGANTVFAFYASDGTVDDAPDYEFFVDNFVVEVLPPPCTTPSAQPSALNFTSVTYNSIAGSFTGSGANKYLVVQTLNSTLSANPVNGTVYTAGQSLGGGTVVQASANTSFTKTGLSSLNNYHFFVFAYNDNCLGEPYYLTTAPLSGAATTLEGPCVDETLANLVSGSGSYLDRSWTGTGGGTWAATLARTDNDINGTAITIRNGVITAPSTSGGVGSITMTTTLPFSDVSGNLTVKVNGNTVGTIAYSSSVQTLTIANVNILGNAVVTIHETNNARVAIDDIKWTCFSTVTWENGAWSNVSGPTSSLEAVIKSPYSTLTNGVFTAKKLTLASGTFTIKSGTNITVVNDVVNNMTAADFVVENNANLLQQGTVNNNSGSITVKRNSATIKRLDYTLWSSPVAGQGLYAFSPLTFANRFYTYNPSTDNYAAYSGFSITGLNSDGVNGTDSNHATFATGTGYLIRTPWNHPTAPAIFAGTFTGVPNNGNVPLAVTNGLFYAVGNPYPSTISADTFISNNNIGNNASVAGSGLYFWRKTNNTDQTNHPSSSYATYTTAGGVKSGGDTLNIIPNGVIQVGEGFVVKATSGALQFNNGQRIANNANQFLRDAAIERHRIWLNLSDSVSNVNQMLISYMTGATQDVDASIDGRFFDDTPTALNSLINNEEFAVQGRSLPFDGGDVVRLAFKAANAGSYTISLDHVDGLFTGESQKVYLKDNQTAVVHDLGGDPYTFATTAGTFNNRFEIVYQSTLGVNPIFDSNSVVIYHQNNEFVVNSGNNIMASIKVFDIRGRLIEEKKSIDTTQATIKGGSSNQVLLVQITSQEGAVITKKVLK